MLGERLIYMDNHATTRCDPRVVEAMLPYFTEAYGNPGSTHGFGTEAAEAVRRARALVASFIGARPEEVVFTSGATESNNLALRGVMLHPRRKGARLVSVTTEHESVLEPIRDLAASGIRTHLMGVRPHGDPRAGEVELDAVGEAVDGDTALVSVMLANNEIGAIQPIRQIADLCHQHGALLHCDATQAVGKMPVDVRQLGVDLMSFSGHKVYGPPGIGGLYVRGGAPRVRLQPAITGGGQQEGRRSGTLNTPAIVGLAEALRLCREELDSEPARLAALRDTLWAELAERTPAVELCGPDPSFGGGVSPAWQSVRDDPRSRQRVAPPADQEPGGKQRGGLCDFQRGAEPCAVGPWGCLRRKPEGGFGLGWAASTARKMSGQQRLKSLRHWVTCGPSRGGGLVQAAGKGRISGLFLPTGFVIK